MFGSIEGFLIQNMCIQMYMRLWGLSKIVVPQMTIEVISPEIMIHCTGTQLSCLPNGPLGYRHFGEPPEKSEWVG